MRRPALDSTRLDSAWPPRSSPEIKFSVSEGIQSLRRISTGRCSKVYFDAPAVCGWLEEPFDVVGDSSISSPQKSSSLNFLLAFRCLFYAPGPWASQAQCVPTTATPDMEAFINLRWMGSRSGLDFLL